MRGKESTDLTFGHFDEKKKTLPGWCHSFLFLTSLFLLHVNLWPLTCDTHTWTAGAHLNRTAFFLSWKFRARHWKCFQCFFRPNVTVGALYSTAACLMLRMPSACRAVTLPADSATCVSVTWILLINNDSEAKRFKFIISKENKERTPECQDSAAAHTLLLVTPKPDGTSSSARGASAWMPNTVNNNHNNNLDFCSVFPETQEHFTQE